MDFALMPSLLGRALIKTVITLWNQDDIADFVACLPLPRSQRYTALGPIEDKVKEKVEQLQQPRRTKEQIIDFIKPIGLQISDWAEYHSEKGIGINMHYPSELRWTPQGTIDKKKTAAVVTKNENYDATERYKLACMYCLEDDVLELWHKMPEACRRMFHVEESRDVRQLNLVEFCIIRGLTRIRVPEGRHLADLSNKCAFEWACCNRNKVAAEYFLPKLTSTERSWSLVLCAKDVMKYKYTVFNDTGASELLCFLLSQMDEEQQRTSFQLTSRYNALVHFLNWPLQSLFIEMFKRTQSLLDEFDVQYLGIYMTLKVAESYRDCDYKTLFADFWKQIPPSRKRLIMDTDIFIGRFLSHLLKIEDEKNVQLVLKDATPTVKNRIIFGSKGICEDLMRGRKWNLLHFIIRECTSSFDEAARALNESLNTEASLQMTKDEWDEYFQVFGGIINEYNERKK